MEGRPSSRGSRPASARHNVNPITGMEMPFSSRAEKQTTRPAGVPQIDLGNLTDDPPDGAAMFYPSNGPDTDRTTVSWGTSSDIWSPRSEASSSYRAHPMQLALPKDLDSARGARTQQQQFQKFGNPNINESQQVVPVSARHDRGQQTSARQDRSQQTSARGAAMPAARHLNAWDQAAVDESHVPGPSQEQKEMYKQYEREMKEGYQKSINPVTEDSIREKIEKLRLDIPTAPLMPDEEEDQERDKVHKEWTGAPYSKAKLARKQDVEELEEEKRKRKLVETVMIDQLARSVVCDPEQNELLSRRIQTETPHPKGSLRTLHHTKIRTQTSATENLLSERVRFDVRVQSHSGRDSLRDLTGFYFHLDFSLTIYEFRRFGKSGKALPFIKRGIYRHQMGRRKGEPYTLKDIFCGGNLDFEVEGQPLPESLMSGSRVRFRITAVDDQAKADIILKDVSPEKRDDAWKRAHLPPTKQELTDLLVMQSVQTSLREHVRRRGVRVFMGLCQRFRKLDEYKDGLLNRFEYEKALIDFKINVDDEKFDDLWELLDPDNTGFADYRQFTVTFLGEMKENRRALVRKVFRKMDANKSGHVAIDDFRKFYNTHKHPMVKGGRLQEDEALRDFLSAFENTTTRGQVTFEEFEEYYEGLSTGIESDQDFINVLRNAWAL